MSSTFETSLLILSTMIFIGCTNDITDSGAGPSAGGTNNITKPDGLASTYYGTWYFYSEDGKIKGDSIKIANGGITGLKTSSGEAINFVKDNFNSKVIFDREPSDLKNYIVYKDGYTGNINLNADIAYVKITNSSKAVIIEGMLSKKQRSATIDNAHVGTYTAASATGKVSYKLDVTADSVSFAITDASGAEKKLTQCLPHILLKTEILILAML